MHKSSYWMPIVSQLIMALLAEAEKGEKKTLQDPSVYAGIGLTCGANTDVSTS